MPYNQFKTLWKDHMPLVSLKTMNVSYSKYLKTTPDFRNLILVEKLLFRGCKSLLKVLPSIGQLNKLGHLDFSGCVILKGLPEPMKQLTNLGYLDLSDCSHLKQLPEQLGDMKGLKMLDASFTAIEQLPDSIVHLEKLVKLKLYKCNMLRKLPEQLGKMQCLRSLNVSATSIEELPDSIGQLSKLEVLILRWCNKLKYVQNSMGNLTSLAHLQLLQEGIVNLPDTVKNMKLDSLSLRCNIRLCLPMILNFSSLKNLDLADEGQSFSSSEPFSLSKLSNLQFLSLRNHGGSFFPELPLNLAELYVEMYAKLEQLPDLSSFKQLKRLHIMTCTSLKSLQPLPPHLQSLIVEECRSLQDVPDLSMLKELSSLIITECSNLKLISLKESLFQVCYRFRAILPNMEIPEWFNYKSRGCTVSFDIAPTLGDNFLGVVFWVVYRFKTRGDRHGSNIRGVITNKTKGITINHHIHARTDVNIVGELKSKVVCKKGDDISAKSGDRIKVSFQSLLYDFDFDERVFVPTVIEVEVEMCGVHVIQRTPSTPY